MKLNEYGIFEYAKNGHSLGALYQRTQNGVVRVNTIEYYSSK